MVVVATYVFMDIEPTGLPPEELNRTKITEISFIAVNRQVLIDTQPGRCPKIANKLNICVYPRRLIHPDCTKVTKLSNELLEPLPPFNIEVYELIDSFLKILVKPICLIAQNGMHFDFPILRYQLEKLNRSLSEDLLCADCLHAFYDIDVIDQKALMNLIHPELKLYHNKDTDRRMEVDKETIPKRLRDLTEKQRLMKARRRMPWMGYNKPELSYKLGRIYERIFNEKPVNLHRAENDCIIALKIAVVKSTKFVHWVDANYCYFSEVKAMTPGVPVGY
ncbi:three prime repair exonuclease 2-like [Achroia grisella]|uniref:three prime repair exonuclease 2-like n=1 Tax=Achroia grisella TaxID=688607 RepID=UPI0027D26C9D|nr:three prime repair exonuclease 2-like [Achroia grisella]